MGGSLSSSSDISARRVLSSDLHELWSSPSESLALAAHDSLGQHSPLAAFFNHPFFEPLILHYIHSFLPDWTTPLKHAVTALADNTPTALADALVHHIPQDKASHQDITCLFNILRNLLLNDLADEDDDELKLRKHFGKRLRQQASTILWGCGIKNSRFDADFVSNFAKAYIEDKVLKNQRFRDALEEFVEEISFALPDENGSVRRMFHAFGDVFHRTWGTVSPEQVYYLSYITILINSEIHLLGPAMKITPRTKEQFMKTYQQMSKMN